MFKKGKYLGGKKMSQKDWDGEKGREWRRKFNTKSPEKRKALSGMMDRNYSKYKQQKDREADAGVVIFLIILGIVVILYFGGVI